MLQKVIVRDLGLSDYQDVWNKMRSFTQQRGNASADEIWIVEHPGVFTLGLNGKPQHIINARDIPVIQCDRGGQVTYHAPGQIVAYILMDLQRRHWGVKKLVNCLEQAVLDLLAGYGIPAERKENAPGVYINGAKIAALGLRVRRGCSYHGLSFNVDMDLMPFSYINPCGFEGLKSTQLKDHYPGIDIQVVKSQLVAELTRQLFTTADAPQNHIL
jgi:lipoyl(octanoyl) transferase